MTSARSLAPLLASLLLASACEARRLGAEVPECERCHGGGGSAAPPASALGHGATSELAVGAHRAHLDPHPGALREPIACDECHVVPDRPDAPGHVDGPHATVTFGALASRDLPAAAWDREARTCTTYCHGATLAADGTNTLPVWTEVGTGQTACGTCHGNPPLSPHPSIAACRICHPETITSSGAIDVAGGKHIDGNLQALMDCALCHPSLGGAHAVHAAFATPADSGYGDQRILEDFSPSGGPTYQFGCGNCHPLDPARHLSGGPVEVSLSSAVAGATGLRALNRADAAYAGGKCSGVYCHSSGQAAGTDTPVFVDTPAWTSAPGALGCDGCHGNPPAYLSGGAGTPTANSHLNLADDGYEFGHFLGMPGPFHSSKHGGTWGPGEDAAPITCQTCHYETTDPAGAGPSGFYWLDTTGTYAVPGGDPGRTAWLAQQQCTYCHKSGGAAAGKGKVLPLRHVNGSRDVVFDPRAALPAISWLPAAPNTPAGPYWMSGASASMPYPTWVTWSGTTVSFAVSTTTYDPTTKRCGNAACHLAEDPVWGTPYLYYGGDTCIACHPF